MATIWDGGLVAIRSVFGEPVVYTGAGLDAATITAIPAIVPADEFQGLNGKGKRFTFEIASASLPEPPRNRDTIVHAGTAWRVIDINQRDDVGAVVLFVERAT